MTTLTILAMALFLLTALPLASAGYLKTGGPKNINFNLQSTETDTITMTTENGYDVDLQFIALNPGGNPMPINSVVGFDTRIEETNNGFKWSYDLNLPNSNFVAKVMVNSNQEITILENKYVVVDGSLISFDDVLEYDYSFTLTKLNNYQAEFIITKDYASKGIKNNDPIVIDPQIISYPANDGMLMYRDDLSWNVVIGTISFRAGSELDTPNEIHRFYMRFDTSEIDIYDTIINATLRITKRDNTTSGGQTCEAILEYIPDYFDLGPSDWGLNGTVINSSFATLGMPDDFVINQIVTNYINNGGYTTFKIIGDYEVWGVNDCYMRFWSNESADSPELEIYWEDGFFSENLVDFNITNAELVYEELSGPCGFALPHDPKIACEDDGDSCIVVLYEHSTLCTQGIKVLLSYDGFESTVTTLGTIPTGFTQAQYLDDLNGKGGELPYDIVYSPEKSAYFIASPNKIYVVPVSPVYGASTYTLQDSVVGPTETLGADISSFDCPDEINYKGANYHCVQQVALPYAFQSDNATNLWGIQACYIVDTGPIPDELDGIFCEFNYDVTNTTADVLTMNNLGGTTYSSCTAGGLSIDNIMAGAYWSGSDWLYNIEGQIDFCTGETDQVINFDTLSTPEDDANHFYFGGNLFYRNSTAHIVYRISTTDFSSYGTPEARYYENQAINEAINQSDADAGSDTNYIAFKRSSDSTGDGIYIYKQTTYPIDINTNNDITATLSCASEGYTTSDTGDIFTLYTPCQTGNEITFVSDREPNVYIDDFDIGSCTRLEIRLLYAENPYDFEFTVKDGLTQENIVGATLELDGDTETTDSNGKATFEIDAISGSTMSRYGTGCIIDVSTDGSERQLTVKASNAGYVDVEKDFTPGDRHDGSVITWDFDDTDLLAMYPDGVVLDVHAYTIDGHELTLDGYTSTVTGNNNATYTFRNGQISLRNYNTLLPAEFLLYDSRSSYNVTVTLDYITGSDSITQEVEQDNVYNINFYLPFSLLDMPCDDVGDCSDNFCDDSGFFHGITGCQNNVCTFVDSDCFSSDLCDETIGCFAFDTGESCTTDNECIFNSNVTTCIDLASMYIGSCGSDGFCKQQETQCSTFCNTTVGYCNEKADCLVASPEIIGYEYTGLVDVSAVNWLELIITKGHAGIQVAEYEGGGGAYISAVCNFENSGDDICVHMGAIPKSDLTTLGISINDVKFSHEGFGIIDAGDSYKISDFSVHCSESCAIELNFCPTGQCSDATGRCLTASTDSGYTSMLWGAWVWFSGLIPVELRMLAWMIFTILAMSLYNYYKPKGSGDNKDTIIVGLVMLFAGFGIGFIHWIFMVLIGAIVSLVLYKTLAA